MADNELRNFAVGDKVVLTDSITFKDKLKKGVSGTITKINDKDDTVNISFVLDKGIKEKATVSKFCIKKASDPSRVEETDAIVVEGVDKITKSPDYNPLGIWKTIYQLIVYGLVTTASVVFLFGSFGSFGSNVFSMYKISGALDLVMSGVSIAFCVLGILSMFRKTTNDTRVSFVLLSVVPHILINFFDVFAVVVEHVEDVGYIDLSAWNVLSFIAPIFAILCIVVAAFIKYDTSDIAKKIVGVFGIVYAVLSDISAMSFSRPVTFANILMIIAELAVAYYLLVMNDRKTNMKEINEASAAKQKPVEEAAPIEEK